MSQASAYFTAEGINGKHAVKEIKRELNTLQGVQSVSINSNKIIVDYDTTGVKRDCIQKKLEELGYGVSKSSFENRIL